MIAAAGLLVIALAATQPPQAPADSSLRASLAQDADRGRQLVRQLLAGASRSARPDSGLVEAARVATLYETIWHDRFLVAEVARFIAWRPAERVQKVTLDSLRSAGNALLTSRGFAAAARVWRRSLSLAVGLSDPSGQGAALGNLGAGLYRQGDLEQAQGELERARNLARAAGDLRTEANALGVLANVKRDRGDLEGARELYAASTAIRVRIGDGRGLAADRNNLGLVSQSLGDLDQARRTFETALADNRAAGRSDGSAQNLVNLANLDALSGAYTKAESRYGEAGKLYQARGDVAGRALVVRNQGGLAQRRGNFHRATALLEQAAGLYRKVGDHRGEQAVLTELATAYAALGDLQAAIDALRAARQLTPPSGTGAAELALVAADVALELEDYRRAAQEYRRAEALGRGHARLDLEAAALEGQSRLLVAREDYPGATVLLQRALAAWTAAGDRAAVARGQLLVGQLYSLRGDTSRARRSYDVALERFGASPGPGAPATLGALGWLALDHSLPARADSLFRHALALLGDDPSPIIRANLEDGRGRALWGLGALAEADAALDRGTAQLERVTRGLRTGERRSLFMANKWDLFGDRAFLARARGRDDEAFGASESLRSRQLLDLVAAGRLSVPAGPADSLTEVAEDLRRHIADLSDALLARDAGRPVLRGPPARTTGALATGEALEAAEREYADVLVRIKETSPGYAGAVRGRAAGWRDVVSRLADDEALIEYLVTDSTSLAFVVTRDTVRSIDLNVSERTLRPLVEFARGTINLRAPQVGGTAWQAPLRRLYDRLILPITASGALEGKHRLIIVPQGVLHYLPFAALLAPGSPEQFLITRFEIAYTPSASVWVELARRASLPAGDKVLVLAPHPRSLPASRVEAEAIRGIYGIHATVLIADAATEAAFRARAGAASVVHLATFGSLNRHNPLFSFVDLRPGDGTDGRLETHELFGLSLQARLVVLSACQTGLASGAVVDIPRGDDWVGLVQGFLFAGARNVLATLWAVEDRATADLMAEFHRELVGGKREAEALALAQRRMLNLPATRHPFYWAGFALARGE